MAWEETGQNLFSVDINQVGLEEDPITQQEQRRKIVTRLIVNVRRLVALGGDIFIIVLSAGSTFSVCAVAVLCWSVFKVLYLSLASARS